MNIKRKLDQSIKQAKNALVAHKKAIAIAGAVVLAGALGLGATLSIETPAAPPAKAAAHAAPAKKADTAKDLVSKGAKAGDSTADDTGEKANETKAQKEAGKKAGAKGGSQGDAGEKASSRPSGSKKPAARPDHKHAWKDHTTTVETWVVDVIPVYEEREVLVGYSKKYTDIGIHCNCGQVFLYTDPGYSEKFSDHSVAHILADEPSNYWTESEWIEDKNAPIYDTQRVQVGTEDHSHYETETIVDYRYCDCGARQ